MLFLNNLGLALFFTQGVSLKQWHSGGLFDREVAYYKRMRPFLGDMSFVTYGNATDQNYANQLDDIRIVCNRWNLPARLYAHILAYYSRPVGRKPFVFKSNQMRGADVAGHAARRLGAKFVARCGYLYSDTMIRQFGENSPQAQNAVKLEQKVFALADQIVVTTPVMQKSLVERYHLQPHCITVVPNYVDIDLFCPCSNNRYPANRICFVGRLDEEKNLFALLDAIKGLNVELALIGSGSLKEKLQFEAGAHQLPVHFLGNIPNHQLPKILNDVDLFILPSRFEGHPKVLLEAMACGLPVIGTDVTGIRELIRHRDTGYLCGTSPTELRAAIKELIADNELRLRIGRNAREYVVENFALERVMGMELALLEKMIE